jgi:cysteine synthase A
MKLYELLESGVRALGVDFGPVKGDCVISGDRFLLLEVAPRLHGPRSSLYALPISGVEPLVPTLSVITGTTPSTESLQLKQDRCCKAKALLPPPSPLQGIQGLDKAKSLPGVEKVMVFAEPGREIEDYRDSSQIPAYLFASGDSFRECEETLKKAEALIQFE